MIFAIVAAFSALVMALVMDLRLASGCQWCHKLSCLPSATVNCSNTTAYPARYKGLVQQPRVRISPKPGAGLPTTPPRGCCEDLPGFVSGRGWNASICAASYWPGQNCQWATTFHRAEEACAAVGARLCTLSELRMGEAQGTGCDHDSGLVWSSTSCVDMGMVGRFAVQGDGTGSAQCILGGGSAFQSGRLVGMRCCSEACTKPSRPAAALPPDQPRSQAAAEPDYGPPPPAPPPAPRFAPSNRPRSAECCEVLSSTYGFKPADGSGQVCAGAPWRENICARTRYWADAEEMCASVGARLCTLAEIQNEQVRDTGCRLDVQQIWTSDTCRVWGFPGHIKAQGWVGSPTSCQPDFNGVGEVHCCADSCGQRTATALARSSAVEGNEGPPTVAARSSTVGPAPARSSECCEVLEIDLGFTHGSRSDVVCSASQWQGQRCMKSASFPEANAICANVGARLCTLAELAGQEAQGQRGCRLDKRLLWTSDACRVAGLPGHLTGQGRDGDPAYCQLDATGTAAVRCCADICTAP